MYSIHYNLVHNYFTQQNQQKVKAKLQQITQLIYYFNGVKWIFVGALFKTKI